MNEKLTAHLYAKYPRIFAQRTLPLTHSLMGFGIECGDGWHHLLDGMCYRLMQIADRSGYLAQADQVKSKWGGLRFYFIVVPAPDLKKDVYGDKIVSLHAKYWGRLVCRLWNGLWRWIWNRVMFRPYNWYQRRFGRGTTHQPAWMFINGPQYWKTAEEVFAEIDEVVGATCALAYGTCEECGAPGIYRAWGWHTVRCGRCERQLIDRSGRKLEDIDVEEKEALEKDVPFDPSND